MGLIWIAVGAMGIGILGVRADRHNASSGSNKIGVGLFVSLGALLLCCIATILPVTAVSTDVDSPSQPVTVQCGSTWGALQGSRYLETDAGSTFDPAHGACRAAAWHRVASLGSAEVVLAALVAVASRLLTRRRRHGSVRTPEQVTV